MNADRARELFASARVARLATVGSDGHPHLVPITFALLDSDTLVSAVDHKPKRTMALRRLLNIATHPAVTVLADHYEEDWGRLWWVRADGSAAVSQPGAEPSRRAAALSALAARYPQYVEQPPAGPVIVVRVERWSGWAGAA